MAQSHDANVMISTLASADLFSAFTPEELAVMARSSLLVSYSADEVVFRPGDPATALYIVESGEVIISKPDEDGGEVVLAQFLQHHCFGELDFLTSTPHNARARTVEPSVLLVFPAPGLSFGSLLESHPGIAARILHRFMVVMAGRIRHSNALLKENSPLIQELKKQVYTDKMTGLFNRTWFEEKLREILSRDPSPLAVMMFKPDNFKLINDTWGHEAGDEAIRLFAREVRRHSGDPELVARIMGNEMGIAFRGLDRTGAMNRAQELQQILKETDLSSVIGEGDYSMTLSIGIALFPDHGPTAAELVRQAHELPLIGRARGGDRILFPEDREDHP